MNAHDVAHANRIGQMFIWSIAALTVIVMAMLAHNFIRGLNKPAPFAYSKSVYYPLNTPLCPGDTLRWRSEFTVRDAPTVLRVVRNLFDVDEQRIVTFDQQPNWITWMLEDNGKLFTFEGSYPLPRDLKAGMYELRNSAGSNVSTVDAYRVPFVIAETCFKKGGTQ